MENSLPSNSIGLIKPNKVHFNETLLLSSGSSLNGFELIYETYGELNTSHSNAILICHALSGDHHVAGYHSQEDKKPGWWDNAIGPNKIIDTNKFSYNEEKTLELNVQLTIKGRTNIVPLKLEIKHLAEELVQLKGYLTFSRTSFIIGEDEWSSTNILKDNASIYANLFLFKK